MDRGVSRVLTDEIRTYWNDHIGYLPVVKHPIGTEGFFKDIEEYRFDKHSHLLRLVDFSSFRDKKVLQVGCDVGTDLILFAKHGAHVTGIDLSERAVQLTEKNFELHDLRAELRVMDGEHMEFSANSFDAVYAHGVLPYTGDVQKMIDEIHRVLRPGGEAILQVFSKRSWFYLLSKVTRTKPEHHDAPAFHVHTLREFETMLRPFRTAQIVFARFPVKTRLYTGLKGTIYNAFFVRAFNAIPRPLVRRCGWHIIAKCRK
jgi:ubiquinone/menaquinone biosynthesis C-methylase UbiE